MSPSFLVLLSFAVRMASSQMGGGAGGSLSPQLWNDETRAVDLNFTPVLRISLAVSGRALVGSLWSSNTTILEFFVTAAKTDPCSGRPGVNSGSWSGM